MCCHDKGFFDSGMLASSYGGWSVSHLAQATAPLLFSFNRPFRSVIAKAILMQLYPEKKTWKRLLRL